MALDGEPLLSVENLSKAFGGARALEGIDFEMKAGETRCLAGENGSGKSTFVKIVSGVYTPDAGTVMVDGQPLTAASPREASAAGVQVIHQDLSLFRQLSVAENISINRTVHGKSRLVSVKEMRRIAAEQLERINVDLPLDAAVSSLSTANRQVVAICRAISMNAKLLFMDEPTTALTHREVESLLNIVHELRAQGLSTIFISHKLKEVFQVADTVTVFRDGHKVGDYSASDLDEASLAKHMTGRDVVYQRYHRKSTDETALLETKDLTRRGNYKDMDVAVRPGDIVGLTGLLGSGRTEFALSLFGLNDPDSGEIRVRGQKVMIDGPWEAMRHGIALLPEDRHSQGIFDEKPVRENVSVTMFSRITDKWRVIRAPLERSLASDVVNKMDVNNKNVDLAIGKLSGGNQQKVVLGKWIFRDPSVLVLDSPTVGVDIGSKADIYTNIQQLADQDMGVILISDEPEEIMANCNRVLVMEKGTVRHRFDEDQISRTGFKEELAALIDDPTYEVFSGEDSNEAAGSGQRSDVEAS